MSTIRGSEGDPAPDPPRIGHERNLDEVEQIARVGSWTLDPATGEATWSTQMYRILGRDSNGPPVGLAEISRLFTPDSVTRVSAAVERAVKTGESWHTDLEIVRPDGGRAWVVSHGIAERGASGAVVRIHGTMQDVTAQRRLEQQLQQAQRLEAVGQLAGGIAHDFNNILTAIRGYTDLVRNDLPPNDPNRADLGHVLGAADRAAQLVNQLLAFSRRQVLQPRVVEPGDVIEEIVPLLRRLLGEGIDIVARPTPGLGRIRVDPGQLGQVIVNLGVNARDAMPRGGRLTIEATNVELDDAYAERHAGARPGAHVLIAVSDTGHGMDPETQAHVFEPFFTTKGPDKGTGMGLATVYGIVKQSGGSIYLYSEPDRGTTFKLYFPRTDAEPAPVAADAPPTRSLSGTETILLVEDDAEVRGYARRVLEAAGFTVLEAPDGAVAIEIAATAPRRIDLLLTDAVLPGIHGVELARRLAEESGLPVLYVSGFTEDTVIQHGVVAPGVRFLAKPYRADDLVRTVRALLDDEA
jgi:signal transduction histidine kinase/ActR/RegA family two-component response regulator